MAEQHSSKMVILVRLQKRIKLKSFKPFLMDIYNIFIFININYNEIKIITIKYKLRRV